VIGVVAVRDGVARATVGPDVLLVLCEGHFPGEPLVPGARLAGLMADVAAALVPGRRLVEVERAVFVARVTPHVPIAITARCEGTSRVAAVVELNGAPAARATLRFAA
jgi:hypothetical protein